MPQSSEQFISKCALEIQTLARCKEITVLTLDTKRGEACRVFSSTPDVFPLFGTKRIPGGQWTDLVVKEQVPALFIGTEQIRGTFSDHKQILSHGIRAVLNVPILSENYCVGSINCLFQEEAPPKNYETTAETVASFLVASNLVDALSRTI
jgi:GAF domain-containing protein